MDTRFGKRIGVPFFTDNVVGSVCKRLSGVMGRVHSIRTLGGRSSARTESNFDAENDEHYYKKNNSSRLKRIGLAFVPIKITDFLQTGGRYFGYVGERKREKTITIRRYNR